MEIGKMNTETISTKTFSTLKGWNVSPDDVAGQAFKGAVLMSSGKNDVQAKTQQQYRNATYA